MSNSTVILDNLTKKFNKKIAVDHINFEIEEGDIFGLLGPNGAGKTTTIRLLGGILKPTEGDARIYNFSVVKDTTKVREIVGILPENRSLYERLTAKENIEFYGKIYQIQKEILEKRIKDLLIFFDLENVADQLVGTFSMGMKQKVALARSLVHQPKLLLLDEPTSNLDPAMTKKLKEYISKLSKDLNTTILISSHHLMEIENICKNIAIINNGKLISYGRISDLKKKLWGLKQFKLSLSEIKPELKKVINKMDGLSDIIYQQNSVFYNCENPDLINPLLIERLVEMKGKIISLAETEKSLEDLYLKLVGGIK